MDDATKKRVVNNLKKAYGHLGKVITMAEDDAYPVSIVQQSLAVQGFIKTVNNLILEDHVSNSIDDAIKSKLLKGTKKKKIIKEILKLYDMAKR
jgi:DNA-binding FrmR family transcriptional regulator